MICGRQYDKNKKGFERLQVHAFYFWLQVYICILKINSMDFLIEKQHERSAGIYIIRSKVSADFYIGSTNCFKERYFKHVTQFKRGERGKLARFVLRNGLACVQMELLKVVADLTTLRKMEFAEIKKHKPTLNTHRKLKKPQTTLANGWKGRKHKDETKKRISKGMPKRAIVMISPDGKRRQFASIRLAERKTGFAAGHIWAVLNNKRVTAYKHKFRYK